MNKPVKKVPPQKTQPKQQVNQEPVHFSGRKFHTWVVFAFIALSFVIYGNSISNNFSLDDEFVMRGDTTVQKGISGIPELFKLRYAWDQKGSYGYRPLVKATFALEYQFFGYSPHVGHAINILLYALLCIEIFYFLRKLLYKDVSDYFLLIVAGIFLVHPIHTEVVDSLKNRDILLVCLLGFYCTYSFVKAFETSLITKRVLWALSGIVAYDMAILCKPDALIFIPVTGLVLFFFTKERVIPAIVSVVLLFVGMKLLGHTMNHVLPHSDYHRTFVYIEEPLMNTHWYQRINLGFDSFWFYLQKLIFPLHMVCYYGYKEIDPQPSLTDINVLMGLLMSGLLVYLIYRNRKDRGMLMFTLLFLGGTMAAYANVIKVGPGIVADRFTFLPSLGFIILMVMLTYRQLKLPLVAKPFGSKGSTLYMITGLIVLLYSGRTIARNPDWKSHFSIYEHDAKIANNSAKLQSLFASACIGQTQDNPNMPNDEKVRYYQMGEAAYMASISIYPDYATSLNNLGMIQFNFYKNYDKAIEFFNRAVKVDTNYTEAFFNLGATYQALNRNDIAEKYFLRAIKANPEYYITYIYLSRLYFTENRVDDVVSLNQNALDHGYSSDAIYVNLGNVNLIRKDTLKAVDYFEKAVAYFNKNTYLCDFLTKYYTRKGNADKAQYYARLYQLGVDAGNKKDLGGE